MQASGQDTRVVENDEVSLAQVLIELVEARMLVGSKLSVNDQHARLLARFERVLRDQLRGEIVVEFGEAHRERKNLAPAKEAENHDPTSAFRAPASPLRAPPISRPAATARQFRIGEAASNPAASHTPAAPTNMVGRRPMSWPAAPPTRRPIKVEEWFKNRKLAFTRPRIE